jgi:hypothetical protein
VDILNVPGIATETAKLSEVLRYYPRALTKMFSREAQDRAMAAGVIRPHRNADPSVDQAVQGFDRLVDFYDTYTGNDPLQKGYKTAVFEVMNLVAGNRINSGDTVAMKKWGPLEWESMLARDPKELQEYMATRMTKNAVGSYNAETLPAWTLTGSNSRLLPQVLLSRWSIDRANRFMQNIIEPAKRGNIAPLIRSLIGSLAISAPLIELMKEKLTGRKPRELSWEEFLKLGGKDTAYTVMLKADQAAFGGILANLGSMAAQGLNKEVPFGIHNPVFTFAENSLHRAFQAVDAIDDGKGIVHVLSEMAKQTGREQLQVMRVVDPLPDTGEREERIARRLGYLPSNGMIPPGIINPFSKQQEYRRGDVRSLVVDFNNSLRRGILPEPPPRAERNTRGVVDEKLVPRAYYKFIEEAQGKEAAEAALKRDQEETRRRMEIYREARGAMLGR